MSRPMLLCGFTFAACAYICSASGTRAAYVLLAAAALALALYAFIKPLHRHISIPAAAASALLASLLFILFFGGEYQKALSYENETEFTGKVVSVPELRDGKVSFDVITHSIGNDFVKEKLHCTSEGGAVPEIYDCVAVGKAYIYVREDIEPRKQAALYSDGFFLGAYFSDGFQTVFSEDKTPFYFILRLRQFTVNAILNGIPGDAGGIVCAMVTGDTGYVSGEAKNAFSNSGASHILAVSGLHLVLFTSVLGLILKLLRCGEKLRSFILIGITFLYCVFTGFPLSCLRAWVMLTVVLSAPFFGRRADGLNSLGLAVFLVTLVNPYASASLGFQLSVFATMGILTLGQRLSKRVRYAVREYTDGKVKKLFFFVSDTFSITAGVSVVLLPLTVLEFGKVSLSAPVTNLFVIPMSYIAMTAGALGAAVSAVPIASDILLGVAGASSEVILRYVTVLSGFGFSSVPVRRLPFAVWLCAAVLLLALAFYIKKRKKKTAFLRTVSVLLVLSFFAVAFSSLVPHPKSIRAYAVPAGRGVCVLLENGNSYAVISSNAESYSAYAGIREYMAFVPVNTLEALVMTGDSPEDKELFDTLTGYFTPKNAFLSRELYMRADTPKSNKAVTWGEYTHFFLWDEIEIEVFNTENKKYAIMEYGDRLCIISFSKKNDTITMREDTKPAQLVCARLPVNCDCSFDSIILSAGESDAEELIKASRLCESSHSTALDGAARIW